MKKFITTISLVLNIILVVLFSFFYNSFELLSEANNVNLNVLPESESITNDATLSIIFGKIDSNFNLILTAITVLFTLFVFLTFFGVKEEFVFRLSELRKVFRKQSKLLDDHKSDILDLRGELSFEAAGRVESSIKELNNIKGEVFKF
jgi:hypothetical protein